MGPTRAPSSTVGLTFDAGALIAVDRGDRRLLALLQEALKKRLPIRVPAGVVGQAWRNGQRQAILARFLRSREVTIHPLDDGAARAAGELCGLSGTSDVIDASVVLLARATGDIVLTSDPDDLLRLDSTLKVERV